MKITMYQVDAFTDRVFGGNPAAVCFLETWLSEATMQAIATENNLSETAFLVKAGSDYGLRWFTPEEEIDLCGHATLASAFLIFKFRETDRESVSFQTKSGLLTVKRSGELLTMDFPSRPVTPVTDCDMDFLAQALGIKPREVWKSRDLFLVYEDESQIRAIRPDFKLLNQIRDFMGVIVTAPGREVDFVSRFFAVNCGIPEDPVTGSSHCNLIPYWSERLKKNELHALQLSRRGGELFCKDQGERVEISGHATLYLIGEIHI
jgi:PhzF family phenazine biosynthesis protein